MKTRIFNTPYGVILLALVVLWTDYAECATLLEDFSLRGQTNQNVPHTGPSAYQALTQPQYTQQIAAPPMLAARPTEMLPPIELDPSCRPSSPYPNYSSWRNRTAETWSWQLFPDGLLWSSYLAGVKESRMGGVWNHDDKLGWIWDITLGGRAAILRYGNRKSVLPSGIQLDIEGAAMTRLALDINRDVEATDYRFGLPITFGNERWQFKVSYYHVSCHLGDEYMIRHMEAGEPYRRINYYRDSLVFGVSMRPHSSLRLYGEIEYAVYSGEMTERLQMQFGAEYAPAFPANGRYGAPFLAVNGLLLEELDFGGSICVQAGWAWRGKRNQIFRIGAQYFYGADDQYEFFDDTVSKVGLGIWYDF